VWCRSTAERLATTNEIAARFIRFVVFVSSQSCDSVLTRIQTAMDEGLLERFSHSQNTITSMTAGVIVREAFA
jgi:hypothetical protein